MERISVDVYNYLSKIDKLGAKDYNELIAKYSTELVHSTIDYMIDENEKNISKFDYYIEKLIIDFDKISDKSILEIYLQDISRAPRLGYEKNEIYGSLIYDIIIKLRNLFKLIDCDYVKNEVIMYGSIMDECQFYLDNCCDREILEQIKKLYLEFVNIRNILVEGNIRLVVSALKNYCRDSNSFMEFIQCGNMGLMKAVEKYNPKFNVKFTTYAYYWIRQSVRNVFKFEFTSATTVSYTAIGKNNSRLKAINALTNELGRKPTGDELAKKMGVSGQELDDIEAAFQESLSLFTPITNANGNETNTTLADMYADRNVDVEREVYKKMLRSELLEVIDECLTEQQKFIVLNKFGLYGEPLSLEQIGAIYGVSKQHIQQTQKRALAKIKRLAGKKLVDFLDL